MKQRRWYDTVDESGIGASLDGADGEHTPYRRKKAVGQESRAGRFRSGGVPARMSKIHTVRDPEKINQWIDGIARNTAREWNRKLRKNHDQSSSREEDTDPIDPDTPFTLLLRKEETEMVQAALKMLDTKDSETDRKLIIAVDFNEENMRTPRSDWG